MFAISFLASKIPSAFLFWITPLSLPTTVGAPCKTSFFLLHTWFCDVIFVHFKLQLWVHLECFSRRSLHHTILSTCTDHFDPVRLAVMVCNGSPHTPVKEHSTLVFEVSTEHPKKSLRKAKVHRPSPDDHELHFLKRLRKVDYRSDRFCIHLFHVLITHVHFKQGFPSCSFHFSMVSHSDIPPPSTLRFPFVLHWGTATIPSNESGKTTVQLVFHWWRPEERTCWPDMTRSRIVQPSSRTHYLFASLFTKVHRNAGMKVICSNPCARFERKSFL